MTYTPRLTPTQAAALVADVANGMTKVAAAEKYGVSVRTVYRRLKMPTRHETQRANRKAADRPGLKPCGTDAAYRRHLRNGEYPCAKCLEAHAKDVWERKHGRRSA